MSPLVADANLSAKLVGIKEPVEIVDESGRRLGRFVPEPTEPEPLCHWEPTLTKEEIDRRVRESSGRTWAEIRQRLEQMRPL